MTFPEFPLPPWVRPVPYEQLRFYVRSRTDPAQEYLVDLAECGFNGACGCSDFQMRKLVALRIDRRAGRGVQKRRCWHIKQAIYYFAELTARMVALELMKAK